MSEHILQRRKAARKFKPEMRVLFTSNDKHRGPMTVKRVTKFGRVLCEHDSGQFIMTPPHKLEPLDEQTNEANS